MSSFLRAARSFLRQPVAVPLQSTLRAASSTTGKNISYTVEDGIAVITIDQQGEKVNTLNMAMSEEFTTTFNTLAGDPKVKAAVLISGKKGNFVAGADIKMFTACETQEEMENISKSAQPMFDMIENGKPVVAAIEGSCMGGGLELALACHYRIASTDPKTVLSVPEVMLGILPGAGGTQRLPKLVGLQAAMPLILTGKNVKPAQAKRMKLVDNVADPAALKDAAILAAKGLADGTLRVNREPKGMQKVMKKVLEETEFGREFMFNKAREMVMKQTKGVYPAPLKIIDVLKESAAKGFGSQAGYNAEAKAFGELGITPESKALVSIYFGQTACKKNPYGAPTKKDNNLAVLGAGLMGAGITEVSVTKGANVVLKDASLEGLGKGIGRVHTNLNKKVKRRRMTQFDADQTMSRITGLTNNDANWKEHFANTDMVIEAVFENLELKHNIIREIEAVTPNDCVFATNTSAIPITTLAQASKRPENFIGMHYFSPVEKMPLLEIIRHPGTSDETAARAFAMGIRQGKTPVFVKDVPGFYVNRSLGPYSDEGLALLLDGAKIEDVDKAMLKFGFPVGPMTLVDEVGIDVAASVGKTLMGDLGARIGTADPQLFDTVIAKGMLGRKTGKGMHVFPKKGRKTVNPAMVELIETMRKERNMSSSGLLSTEDIQMRMATRFVNETAHCLQDEIVANPVVGDIAAIFGIGFPPFRGGPFRFLDAFGVQKFVDVMYKYRGALGPQFEPAQILKDYAKENKKFHS